MPDVSKLRLDGTSYDIKDDNARKHLVMVNEEPVNATKVVVNTSDDQIELALQSDVDEIAVDVAAIQTDITNIQKITNRLVNRYIVFCGDSYTAGHNPDGDSFTSWADICASALGLTSSDYKMTASTGCGLLRGTTYLQQLTNLVVPNDNAVTDIVVAGGTNDVSYSKANLLTALGSLIGYCKTRYPNATVHMACIGWTNNSTNRLLLIRNVQSVYKQASAYGGDYIVGSEYLLHNYDYYCTDMSHPNQTGQTLLGVAIANGLLTGYASNYYQTEENLVIDPYTTLFTTVPLTLNQYVGLDGVQLIINGGYANFKSGLTALNNDYDCKLGTLSARKGFIAGITESLAGINVSVKLTYVNSSGTSVFVVRPATFWIDSTFAVHVRLHLDGSNIGGNSLTSLYIYPTSATLKYSVV